MENHHLATIIFTDIVGYTRLMGLDNEKAMEEYLFLVTVFVTEI